MEIALRVAGVKAGDEVITTPLSWVATSNVVLEVGARPVFVDIDPSTRNIDLSLAEKAMTARTRAIIPVDLAGLPVDRDRLYAIARARGIRVVEDAAQSFGSTWKGRRIGSFGDFVSFSFHANKNITTGEGGCLVLNDEREASLAEQYRLQGVVRSGHDGMQVDVVGGKFNMTDIAARIGLGQLPRLDEFTARRRDLARAYFEAFEGVEIRSLGIGLPPANFTDSNWHMFQVILPEERMNGRRADIMEGLKAEGIGTGVHYPAIHLFSLYKRMGWKEGDFPNAERAGRNILTLPLFPAMELADPTRVVAALARVLRSHLRG
jgi:dTDP-4-amino-4,6-dideoxygalactose transaminase